MDQELDDELVHYLELSTQEKMRAGMTRREAERAARIELGGVEATKERVRSSGWEGVAGALGQDVRYGVRSLRRNAGFSAVAVLTLALGIGATTAMFSVVNGVMLRPLPYRDSGRLALIWTDDVQRGLHQEATAYRTIMDWKARSHVFQGLAYYSSRRVAPINQDPVAGRDRARSAMVSGNLFDVLGAAPLRGRLISTADEAERAAVVVISHGFWQRWYGGAPDVIGKTLVIDDGAKTGVRSVTVIGVMPASFYFPDKNTELWTPSTGYWRFDRESSERFQDWARSWTAVGRLAPGASLADARADLKEIGRQLTATYPSDVPDFPGFGTTVMPVLDSIAGSGLQSALWLLLGATLLVLLIACANVANLQLARGATRQAEFAVRRALGGGRFRLLRLLAAENLILALVGGMLGLLIAWWSTRLLAVVATAYLPRLEEIVVDARVLLFALAASVVAALVFGFAPALRLSGIDASETLKEGARGMAGARMGRARGLVVLAECCLAIVMLAGAGLLLRSLARLTAVDPGFDPRGVMTIRVEFGADPPPTALAQGQARDPGSGRARLHAQSMFELIARVRALPGVQQAGFIDDLFIGGVGNESITIPGRAAGEIAAGELHEGTVSPGFFETLRVPVRRGRALNQDDTGQKIRALWSQVITDRPLAEKQRLAVAEPAVVNEAFVRRYFPDEDPIGRRFCIDPTGKTYWYEIVGVVGDMRRQGLERTAIPQYYGPFFPAGGARADLVVRAESDAVALSLASTIRLEILRAFPGTVVASVNATVTQLGAFSAQRRLQTWLLTVFAVLALTLAAIGIFGLVHYAIAERTREIGVRIALGATPRNVLASIMADGMRMPAIGIVAGLAGSLVVTRVMAHLLFGITATDPITFGSIAVLLGLVAASACYVAARRALRIDPMEALRNG